MTDRLTLALAEAIRNLTHAAKAVLEELPSDSPFIEARLLIDVQAFAVRLRSDAETMRNGRR